jgi:hypothetical protein
MPPKAWFACIVCLLTAVAPVAGAEYKVTVRHLGPRVYQAQSSKVLIETRLCGDWMPDDDTAEEAILHWEGSYGNNWILFTASRKKCDVAMIR